MRRIGFLGLLIVLASGTAWAQSINVQYPDASVTVLSDSDMLVKWTKQGSMENMVSITLMCAANDQIAYWTKLLVPSTPNVGQALVHIPKVVTNRYRIRVAASASVYGNSQEFNIVESSPGTPPDLVVCLEWDGVRPLINQNKRFYVRVINKGGSASHACMFEIYIEGIATHRFPVPPLAPAKEYLWHHFVSWPTMGHKTISVTVDSLKAVAESNENNNYVKATMSVRLATMDKYVGETNVCSDR